MSTDTRPQTLSQALLNLERIRKIEDPITFGLIGLHKAQEYHRIKKSEKAEMKRYLRRFEEFYDRFETIIGFERGKDVNAMEKWLTEKPEKEVTSRIDTFLGIFSSFSSEDERSRGLDSFKAVAITVKDTLRGHIDRNKIETSLQTLETLRKMLAKKVEIERKTSEKIISRRTPSI